MQNDNPQTVSEREQSERKKSALLVAAHPSQIYDIGFANGQEAARTQAKPDMERDHPSLRHATADAEGKLGSLKTVCMQRKAALPPAKGDADA